MSLEAPGIFCCLCNMPIATLTSLQQHLLYQHTVDDLCMGLIVFANKSQYAPQVLCTPDFELFFSKYPYLRQAAHPTMDIFSSILRSPSHSLYSPNPFGHQSSFPQAHSQFGSPRTPLMSNHNNTGIEFLSSLFQQSTPVRSVSPMNLVSPSFAHDQEKNELTPEKAPRKRLPSSQLTNETEIDVVNLSQKSNKEDEDRSAGGKNSEERKFKCDECKNSYKLKAHLTRHKKSAHSNERPYVCEFCSKAFKLKELLNQHLTFHQVLNPFSCDMCSAKFAKAADLKYHKGAKHNSGLLMKCSYCDFVFLSIDDLKSHLDQTHKESNTKSSEVKKSLPPSLRRRNKSPASSILFICDICKKGFVDKEKVIAHLKRAHSID